MNPFLRNPVYHSLLHNERHLGTRSGRVAWFDEAVSPFAGFEEGYETGFADLHQALPAGSSILYATPHAITPPPEWTLEEAVEGQQFLYEGRAIEEEASFQPVRLVESDVPAMMELAALTRPGPFGPRTIEFGHYYGVWEGGQLVAMTGQRLHVHYFTEISAVCTHPDCLGKGYATALVRHQAALILRQGGVPFLHVRADNHRAIAVYERLGFTGQGPMHFYFLKKA